jgi:hypothetical protein
MTPEKLQGLSLDQLKTLAAESGLAKTAQMGRAELITALLPLAAPPTSRAALTPPEAASPPSSMVAQQPAPSHPAEHGLPIPDQYGRDRLVLMVQDPQHIFAYWEITPQRLEEVRQVAGLQATPVLVLMTTRGTEQREVDLRGGNYYLAVAPAGTYQAQISLRDLQGNLHPLATSNQVATPCSSVSARTDEQWMAVDETFHELLAMAGLPGGVGSSLARFTEQRLQSWTLKDHLKTSFSSAQLAGGQIPAGQMPPLGHLLSSYSLSSHSLGSHSLANPLDVETLLKR